MKKETKKKKKKMSLGMALSLKIWVTMCILGAIWMFLCECHRISGNAMYPSLRDGDLCFVYKIEPFVTGDVVYYEDSDGNKRFGRVVAVGGQSVEVREDGGYTVNGYEPAEKVTYPTYRDGEGIDYPCELDSEKYFILNDFREDTTDSRKYGAIPREHIVGKVLFQVRRRDF